MQKYFSFTVVAMVYLLSSYVVTGVYRLPQTAESRLYDLGTGAGSMVAPLKDNFLFSSRSTVSHFGSVLYLHKLNVLSSLELLKIWCESTAQMIFPHRKIGRLANGYEASFLVLAGNPLEDFTHIRSIRMRFKQGHLLKSSSR